METELAPSMAAKVDEPRLYPWMRPAWFLGRFRGGLRAATASDAARLRELPSWFGGLALPLVAIVIPLLLSAGHALRASFDDVAIFNAEPWTFLIWITFTESISFVLIVAVIGLVAPAAGVLVVLAFGASDLVAAFVVGDMRNTFTALIGRLVSYAVLWLLVVEVPLLGRLMVEWRARSDEASRKQRVVGIAIGAVVVAALVYIWANAARILIGAVPFWGGLVSIKTISTQLFYMDVAVATISFAAAAAVFWVRYLGPTTHVSRVDLEPGSNSAGQTIRSTVIGIAVGIFVLAAYVDQPIDAVMLIIALAAARPIATVVLRATRIAPLLAAIPWPLRLIGGFAVTFFVASTYMQGAGVATFSRFGNMVIALAAALVIMEIFLAADDVASATLSRARRIAEGVAIGGVLLLAMPFAVLAHDTEQTADAAAGAAIAGAAAAAAAARRRGKGPGGIGDDPSDLKPIKPTPSKPFVPGNPWDKTKPNPPKPDKPKDTPQKDPPKWYDKLNPGNWYK